MCPRPTPRIGWRASRNLDGEPYSHSQLNEIVETAEEGTDVAVENEKRERLIDDVIAAARVFRLDNELQEGPSLKNPPG